MNGTKQGPRRIHARHRAGVLAQGLCLGAFMLAIARACWPKAGDFIAP